MTDRSTVLRGWDRYNDLNKKQGFAYAFYLCSSVLLPNLVTAVVLFYGGQLVIEGKISGGKVGATCMAQLVSTRPAVGRILHEKE